MLRRFAVKLTLFLLPFVAPLGGLLALAAYSGEAMPLALVKNHDGTSVIYSPPTPDVGFALKLWQTIERQPDVVIIGSSRVYQFRAEMLNRQPDAFFNASGSNLMLADVIAYINGVEDAAPEYLIAGIDQRSFNADYPDWSRIEKHDQHELNGEIAFMAMRSVFTRLLQGETDLSTLLSRTEPVYGQHALGVDAIENGRGYRLTDGSLQWGSMILNPEEHARWRAQDYERMTQRHDWFMTGREVNQNAIDQLDVMLRLAQSKGITVIGFAPPFAPSIYEGMATSGEHEYLPRSQAMIGEVFESYDFSYFNYTDPATVGIPEDEFFDGIHTSELGSLRIYAALLQALPDHLGAYSDLPALQQIAHATEDTMRVFTNPNLGA